MSSTKIQATKNYRLFKRSDDNRETKVPKHRQLLDSMKTYGFLRSFPIVVHRDDKGQLIVKDGQHRLLFAEQLGLTVYWVEETVDFDIAKVNSTSKTWGTIDYAKKFATNGNKHYEEGIAFAESHKLSISAAFTLLAGVTGFTNIKTDFENGLFKVKDRKWADSVAKLYVPMVALSAHLRKNQFLDACMAVCRVDGFDHNRMIAGAERCREKLVNYASRDAYLDMLESVYNFGRSKLVGLKAAATMAMRERNPAHKNAAKKEAKEAA